MNLPSETETRIVIVGGGIAGLAAAYRLRQVAPQIETLLVEAESRLGGKILTERTDGFLIEAGPDSFLSRKPRGLGLCRELGLEAELEGPNEETRRSYVLFGGRLHQMPEGLTGLVPARLEPLLASRLFSEEGKAQIAREPDVPPAPPGGDESLAVFVERRFGPEMYGRLVEPLMAGIYAGDGRRLSLMATFPQLRRLELEHGSLIKGVQASGASLHPTTGTLPAFLAPKGGMGGLVAALERGLGRTGVIRGQPVTSVNGVGEGYSVRLASGDTLSATSVILATPAPASARLVSALDRDLAAVLDRISYVSSATVSLAYSLESVPHPLNGYGYIVPRVEGRPVLACTWTSTKFPDRAPHGYALLRAFLGRAGEEDVLDRTEELLQLVRAELREVLGITCPPALHRVYRWPQAMPQYNVGHLDLLAGIEERLAAHPGLFLAGNAYRGVGIPDCIESGENAAVSALALLFSR